MDDRNGVLREKDLVVLGRYVATGNRELYWNYLAQIPGNDGYGLLALGVVRNDNMPGATANEYAASFAKTHNDVVLTERQWDDFGVDLIRNDLYERQRMMKADPGLALNLPGKSVEDAHDKSFQHKGISPDAWTPRKLLEAARNHPGRSPEENEKSAEDIWKSMLKNDLAGVSRTRDTLLSTAYDNAMNPADRLAYVTDMSAAYFKASQSLDHLNPDLIGSMRDHYVHEKNGSWTHVRIGWMSSASSIGTVTDPDKIQELNDTRELRLEQEAGRRNFHPDDPGKLQHSPRPLANAAPRTSLPSVGDDPVYAAIRRQLPFDVSDDKVAEATLASRKAGISRPNQLAEVAIEGRSIVCEGRVPGRSASVSMDSPAPAREASMLAVQNHDVTSQELAAAQHMQASQQQAQRGPVMRL